MPALRVQIPQVFAFVVQERAAVDALYTKALVSRFAQRCLFVPRFALLWFVVRRGGLICKREFLSDFVCADFEQRCRLSSELQSYFGG